MKKNGIAVAGLLTCSLLLTACGSSSDGGQPDNDPRGDDKFLGYNPLDISADSMTGTWVAIGSAKQIKYHQELIDTGNFFAVDESKNLDYELTVEEKIKLYFIIRPTESGDLEYLNCIGQSSDLKLVDVDNKPIIFSNSEEDLYNYSLSGKITEENIIVATAKKNREHYEEASVRQFKMIKISNKYSSFGEFSISSPNEKTETFDVDCMQKVETTLTDNYGHENSGISFDFEDSDLSYPDPRWAYMQNLGYVMQQAKHFEGGNFFGQKELSPTETAGHLFEDRFQFSVDEETNFTTQITFDGKAADKREENWDESEAGSSVMLHFNGHVRIDLPTQ